MKLYQAPQRVFQLISKHFEFGSKNSAAPRLFNPVLGVWKLDEAVFLVFDIVLKKCYEFVSQRALFQSEGDRNRTYTNRLLEIASCRYH